MFALKLPQRCSCETHPAGGALDPCGHLPLLRAQVAARTHPDLELVSKPADKSAIPVAALIGDKEHRMQEGLCHKIGLKPYMGGRKIAIIDDADALNVEGANALLKTLEEPPPRSVLILIGTSAKRQAIAPTICSPLPVVVAFQPLASETIADLLVAQKTVTDPAEARRIAAYSGGSLERAAELADPELWSFRADLLGGLAHRTGFEGLRLSQLVSPFIDAAGKDAPPRRARARLLAGFAIDFFRAVIHRFESVDTTDHDELERLAEQAIRNGWTEDAAIAALERTLETLEHIDRNANQTTMVESWFDELAAR